MRRVLSGIPGLYWVAFVFLGLAMWVEDSTGIFIAVACMVIGTLQLVFAPAVADSSVGPDSAEDAG
ncbi:MAG: hypothetical protein WB471_03835 [Nocardioides sp.]